MSVSHFFYLDASTKEFPDELLSAFKKKVKQYHILVEASEIDKQHLCVCLKTKRPALFYITTQKEDALLPILDKAMFSFSKYWEGKYNDFFCELALIAKYYLKDKLTVESDGLCEFIDFSWAKAQEKLKSEGINIKLEFDDRLKVFIDGEEVHNRFDEDGTIFKTIFIPITPTK